MRKPPVPVETNYLCHYGCGAVAKFKNASGNLMCLSSSNSCPALRLKNSKGLSLAYESGSRTSQKEVYFSLPTEVKKKMNWNKGLTKENNPSVKSYADKLKGREGTFLGKTHSQEAKDKISKAKTEWLRKSENRANLGRHKKSWLEQTFIDYLVDQGIKDWVSEKHFWSPELNKNFYVDFLFEGKRLIIELDGNQHLKTKEHDAKRDEWFTNQGYTVTRIDVYEFRKRFFSGLGFLDILGC
jgi:very-short-patch-repair endonuclease